MTGERPAWRPDINKAPRDGRQVELRTEQFGRVVRREICCWRWGTMRGYSDGLGIGPEIGSYSAQGWWIVGVGEMYQGSPTHWRQV